MHTLSQMTNINKEKIKQKNKPVRVRYTQGAVALLLSKTGKHTPASYHATESGPPHAAMLALPSILILFNASAPALLSRPPLIHT